MRNKFLAVVLGCALVGPASLARAATAEFTLDWTQAALSMSSGMGSLVNIGGTTNIDTQLYTENDVRFDGGSDHLDSSLGSNSASGKSGGVKALTLETGESRVNVGNGAAVILDLQAGAKGVFKVPFAYLLSTTRTGDVSAGVSYSFDTYNYQPVGGGSVPSQIFSGSFIANGNESKSGQGFIEITLNNTTDQLLRFQLVQSTGAFTSVDGVSAVPEPSTYAMLLLGLASIGYAVRRRS